MVTMIQLLNFAISAVRRIIKKVVLNKQSELAKYILKLIKRDQTNVVKFTDALYMPSFLIL